MTAMSWGDVALDVGKALAVPAAELAYKALTGQLKSKDDVGQALARMAVDVGMSVEDLSRYITDEGARRTEEAVALAGVAVYGLGEPEK